MGPQRHSRTVNLLGVLGGLRYSPILASACWRDLCIGGGGGLKAAFTLIGAGTVGAILVLRCTPNSVLSSRLLGTKKESSRLKSEKCSSNQEEAALTIPGLHNAGNNCFLNVILQALASSKALLTFMAVCAELTSKVETKSRVTGSNNTVSMPLAVAVSTLINDLSQLGTTKRTSSPRRVMLALSPYVQHFDLATQQDAAEALVHLASALQEERGNYLKWLRPTLQSFSSSLVLGTFSSSAGTKDCKKAKGGDPLLDSWRGHLHWPLEGTLASSLTCKQCAYQFSTQFQFFNDITLSPLRDEEGNIMVGCTLEDCLDQFTGPEWVDSVKCSNCSHRTAASSLHARSDLSKTTIGGVQSGNNHKNELKIIEECGRDEDCKCELLTRKQGGAWRDVYTNASKQLKIGRSPEVVCFQIQRVVMAENGAMKKLTGHVSFPKILDLFPFTIAAEDSTPLKEDGRRGSLKEVIALHRRASQSPSEKDLSHVDQTSWVNSSELLCKGGADSIYHSTTEKSETLTTVEKDGSQFESCLKEPVQDADSEIGADEQSADSEGIQSSLEISSLTDGNTVSEQLSNLHGELGEESQSTSHIPSAGEGGSSPKTPSSVVNSLYSLYSPRVLPPLLQQFSLLTLPNDGQPYSVQHSQGKVGNLTGSTGMPKSTSRFKIQSSKKARKLLYELVSVVVHQGGPQSGHYVVYRKIVKRSALSKINSSREHSADNQSHIVEERQISAVSIDTLEQPCAKQPLKTNSSCDQITEEEVYKNLQQRLGGTDAFLEQQRSGIACEKVGSLSGRQDMDTAIWFRVSDMNVQRVTEQEVLGAYASLLFYEQL